MAHCVRLSKDTVMRHTRFSRSQLYCWQQGEALDRKERARKVVPEEAVENAVAVIAAFPHFSGRKGQAYLLYHQLGYLSMSSYDQIKKNVKRLLGHEVMRRQLFPERAAYEHVRATKTGEIWAEDFTEVVVEGHTFKVAVLLDVFDHYYLGRAVDRRATAGLVGRPVEEALEVTGGRGPEQFLLSDNGRQYLSAEHGRLLTSAEIVQRRIPACVPQYNGSAEGGMRELKSVFYNVWARRTREGADKEKKPLLERVRAAVDETLVLMNEAIPRPSLGGVTPADVHHGTKEVKRQEIQAYRQKEEAREVPAWTRSYWAVLKSGLKVDGMSSDELLTKLAFFHRRPLRRIAQRNREGVG